MLNLGALVLTSSFLSQSEAKQTTYSLLANNRQGVTNKGEIPMNENKETKEMNRCRDCAYLVSGDNGEWICDDCCKEIHSISDDECSANNNY